MLLFRDTFIFKVYTLVICFKKILWRIQDSEVQIPCIHPDDMVFHPDARQTSNIRPDDENFLSRLPSVSRSFQLFQVASVWTSQQHVRTPFSVRQVKWFPFQKQIWEDSCNRPDAILDKASRAENVPPFWHQSALSRSSVLIIEIACSRSETVRTLGQHRPETALFRKEFQRIWKADCTVVRPDNLSYRPVAA
jgi:hypothetical protein